MKKNTSKKKIIQQVIEGKIYIHSTFNNTMVTITDIHGNVLGWASSGSTGFKGARKSTPFASQQAAKTALDKVVKLHGLQKVSVYVSGVGAGRESAIRVLPSAGVRVIKIKDITPIPHNGPRAKKPRRV